MVERSGRSRFVFEPSKSIGICRQGGGEDFEGHVSPEPWIARSINFAHAAGTDRGNYFVGTNARPRTKAHVARLYSAIDRHHGSLGGPTE